MAAIGDERREVFLQTPDFAIGATAIFGRIEQYAVIAAVAPDFAGDEFGGILHDPADGPVRHARQVGIGASLGDGFFRGVDMNHARAAGRHGQRSDASIAKQVHHLRVGFVGSPFAHPVPYRRHVRKEAQMAEGGATGLERDFLPAKRPAFGRDGLVIEPAAPALLVRTGHEFAVRRPVFGRGRPHRLRFGANEAEAAIALQLAAMARIDQAIIGPGFADEGLKDHRNSPFGLSEVEAPA